MKYKASMLLLLLISCLLLMPDPYMSNIPPTSCRVCNSATPRPEIITAAFGTAYAELTRIRSLTGTATSTPISTATKTPPPTETIWRTEPVSTRASATYARLDIYGLENLPVPIIQPSRLPRGEGAMLAEKIIQYFKENNIQSPSSVLSVFVDQVVSLDVDQDGKREIAASYVFPYDEYSYALGVAIIKDRVVLASTLPEVMGAFPQTRLLPVQLSANQVGLFYHVVTTTAGSGIYPFIHRRIFIFQKEALQTVWTWDYPGGARAGAAYRHFANEKVEFKHLTGQTYADILLTRQVEEWDFPEPFFGANPANYTNYDLHLPGGIVFSFDGKAYRLSHYYDGKKLFPIHPADFFIHAPRVAHSNQAKEDLSSTLHQIEYMDALDGYGQSAFPRSVEVRNIHAVWDEHDLDLQVLVIPWGVEKRSSTIWIGLDADLQRDFNDHLLNEDDYLLKIEIPDARVCQDNLSVQMTYPQPAPIPFRNQLSGQTCIIDLSIPLEAIHLDIFLPRTPGKVLKYENSVSGYPLHQYFPQAGMAIGFTVFSEDDEQTKSRVEKLKSGWYHPLPFDIHDPTTWGTLIFMADR